MIILPFSFEARGFLRLNRSNIEVGYIAIELQTRSRLCEEKMKLKISLRDKPEHSDLVSCVDWASVNELFSVG